MTDFEKMWKELELAVCPEQSFLDKRPFGICQQKALEKVKWLHEQAQELHELKKKPTNSIELEGFVTELKTHADPAGCIVVDTVKMEAVGWRQAQADRTPHEPGARH